MSVAARPGDLRAWRCVQQALGSVPFKSQPTRTCHAQGLVCCSPTSTPSHPTTRTTLSQPPCPCRSILSDSYRTPLHMLHPPHIIALGALCLAGVITQLDLRAWLEGLDVDFARVGAALYMDGHPGWVWWPACAVRPATGPVPLPCATGVHGAQRPIAAKACPSRVQLLLCPQHPPQTSQQVHEVAAEMLSFYEHHAAPISAATAQQHLDLLGLPPLPAPQAQGPPQQQARPPAAQQAQQQR